MKQLFINGNIHTFNRLMPVVESVVVENGRIIDLGSTDDMLLQWGRSGHQIIDLDEKTVTPGLIDSHLHLSGIAGNYLNLDLTSLTSKKELLNKLKEKADKLSEHDWLLGRGWDENLFTDGDIPTIKELDFVAPHVPLFLPRICGHAFLVNSKALERVNYHSNISVPEGGLIELDNQTKQPTGLLLETASTLIEKHIPEASYDETKRAMRKAIKLAIRNGLTSVHTNDPLNLGGLTYTYNLFDELINQEQMLLRCNLLINHEFIEEIKDLGFYTGFGNDSLKIGAIKIFSDGALGRRTAHLSKPYSDETSTYGESIYNEETLYNIINNTRHLHMPVAIHTIGDQALENVLDILDQFPLTPYRDRLIHVQVLREDLIQRLAEPGRCADIQPRFLAGDFPWVQNRLGDKRMEKSYAWKSLLDAGVLCSGGSDAPVEPVNPLLGIHAAVTRKLPKEMHNGYNQQEKLSIYDAFKLFTVFGAYPTNEETIKGTIERGKLADMTVYSKNPFTMKDPDDLLNLDIDMTIIGGKVAYSR
ncbi:amidohydrolase [Virgibacillus sp. MSJ-26]|uniref:amidohydrolase n=1 Tax=Virgibacillus sp. MSJ-26 TaxID=2841522 RepID=UPI001C0FFD07|nr:amidohydrolase [Virgibacillus sp. MSJ-26]MBU5467127.1 amidohydrolase [Virgibacillus sp. MSJ-26]